MVDSMEVTIPEVDDFHHHFRDGEVLKDTVRHASRMFRRAVSYIKALERAFATCLWNHRLQLRSIRDTWHDLWNK